MEDSNQLETEQCAPGEEELSPALAKLSPRHREFVIHYTGIHGSDGARWNASEAALAAGYSPRNAGRIGWETRNRPDVKAAIEEVIESRKQQYEDRLQRAVQELESIAYSNLHDVIEAAGNTVYVKSIEEIPIAARCAIAEVKEMISPKGERSIAVKMHSKTSALGLLAKMMGGIVERYAGPDGKSGIPVDHSHGLTKAGRDKLLEALGLPVKGDGDNGESK